MSRRLRVRTAAPRRTNDASMQPRALLVVSAVALWTGAGLTIERTVGAQGQLVLAAVTIAVLAALLALHTPAQRAQTLLVVAVASVAEVVGSLLWGLYTYRLENLPAFVPPGHGLVFLGGVALARSFGARASWLVGAATVGVGAWGVVSLTAFGAPDVAGAIGCFVLLAVLVKTRRPVYAGVFFAVAALELAGTALGTWTWASTVPGLGLAQANPPSGVASGYVLFDVIALALAPRLAGRWRRRGLPQPTVPFRSRLPRPVGHGRQPAAEPGTRKTSRPWSNVVSTISRRPSRSRSPIDGAAGTPMPLPFVP
ncbi:MAG TPA: hypothetical protein VH950_02840 [Gaiellaceae bacterium]